jgi:hypothetical protein
VKHITNLPQDNCLKMPGIEAWELLVYQCSRGQLLERRKIRDGEELVEFMSEIARWTSEAERLLISMYTDSSLLERYRACTRNLYSNGCTFEERVECQKVLLQDRIKCLSYVARLVKDLPS